MEQLLSSSQNPRIKYLLSLEKLKGRRKENKFTIEGIKELQLASQAGYHIEAIYFCPEIISQESIINSGFGSAQLLAVSKNLFEKIAYRESTGGVIAIASQRKNDLSNITLKNNALLLVLEGIEKPGNLGAVLRTADAAGVDAVISCDPQTDFYNPNVVRSSVGCVFTNQIASATSTDTIAWLQKNNFKIFCTYLSGSVPYTDISYNQPCAIVMGSEAFGLTDPWVKNSDANILIPMHGKIDSMNVSVSAAIVIFEALRQRRKI